MLLDRGSLPSETNCQDLPEEQARTFCGPQLGPRGCVLSLPCAPGGSASRGEAGAGKAVICKCRCSLNTLASLSRACSLRNGRARRAPSDSQNASGFPPQSPGSRSSVSRSGVSSCHQKQWSKVAKNELWNQIFLGLNLRSAIYESLRELANMVSHPEAVL